VKATPPRSSAATGRDPLERLLWRTRWRLALFTLVLVTALLVAIGLVTALVATRLMHETIDQTMEQAMAVALTAVDRDDEESHHAPAPAGWETQVLLLDGTGRVLPGQPEPALTGLPDLAAVGVAALTGFDEREVTVDGQHLRLMTRPVTVPALEDNPAVEGFAQAAYRMGLHERQEAILLWTIALVCAVGILGAGVVTVLVTRRALQPIRAAFTTERRFVAAASHELRTPVAIVRASAEILERERLVADDGRPLVADIVAEADRMGLLVTDLLTLASAEAGALAVERRSLELVGWLDGLSRRVESMADPAGLTVRTAWPEGRSVVVEADEDRLAQLLLILVDNAIEHSPPGGTLRLELGVGGGRAAIAVSDQGTGVPEADRERIFEPFARLPGRRRTTSGSGLGLAIARQLAMRHGADLVVDDAPGGGARFTLRLPLSTTGASAQAVPGAHQA
jgi:signal transduction histidine kinase